ncbi:MAG: Fic family protein [Elusimicrobia bacterium]|nr:Fic family protein [Elusimicrobiota bacterium]
MAYVPAFQTTPHLLKVLEEISALNVRIQSATVGITWVPSLQKDAAARQVHGSTAIEGNPLTLAEVKILAEGGALPNAKPQAIQEVLNYFVALRFIEKNADTKEIGVRDVLKLHSIIGQKGVLDREPIGLFRPYQVRVGNHLPPKAGEVPGLMSQLLEWLNGAGRAWPAVVSSAILHYQFEFIHPFGDGNGRVGRALAAWQLYRRKLDTSHIFAVDEVLLEDRQGYYRALNRAQTQGNDLTGWVEYIAEAINEALERAWKRIESVNISTLGLQLTLTPKQEKLLSLLRESPLGIHEIQKALGVTKPGAHHIIKPLLAAGLLKRVGGHKTGKYQFAAGKRK